jgi:hypothetical protein
MSRVSQTPVHNYCAAMQCHHPTCVEGREVTSDNGSAAILRSLAPSSLRVTQQASARTGECSALVNPSFVEACRRKIAAVRVHNSMYRIVGARK